MVSTREQRTPPCNACNLFTAADLSDRIDTSRCTQLTIMLAQFQRSHAFASACFRDLKLETPAIQDQLQRQTALARTFTSGMMTES